VNVLGWMVAFLHMRRLAIGYHIVASSNPQFEVPGVVIVR